MGEEGFGFADSVPSEMEKGGDGARIGELESEGVGSKLQGAQLVGEEILGTQWRLRRRLRKQQFVQMIL